MWIITNTHAHRDAGDEKENCFHTNTDARGSRFCLIVFRNSAELSFEGSPRQLLMGNFHLACRNFACKINNPLNSPTQTQARGWFSRKAASSPLLRVLLFRTISTHHRGKKEENCCVSVRATRFHFLLLRQRHTYTHRKENNSLSHQHRHAGNYSKVCKKVLFAGLRGYLGDFRAVFTSFWLSRLRVAFRCTSALF